MQTLEGTVTRIRFIGQNRFDPAGEPFVILELASGHTVKGKMTCPQVDWPYRFWGEWKPQRNGYKDAFEFSAFEPLVDRSSAGQAEYLVAFVKNVGLGKAMASRIVDKFGPDTLDVLRADPSQAMAVQDVTEEIVEAIRDHFERSKGIDPKAYARLTDLFNQGGHRVGKKTIEQLCKDFGSNAPDKVIKQPYLLLCYPRMGWKTVDSFAITTAEYHPEGIDRQVAAIAEAVESIVLEGHTYATRAEIEIRVESLIGITPSEEAWERAIQAEEITGDEHEDQWSTPRIWTAEQQIAYHLDRLARTAKPFDFELDSEGLKGDQVAALEVVQNNGVSLLIGPPGCGKSYTIAKIVRSVHNNGWLQIRIAAPTGKAAKRASELLCGAANFPADIIPSSTIHKVLNPVHSSAPSGVPGESAKFGRGREGFEFGHNEKSPLPVELIIIDESSMVDVRLGSSLLAAIPSGARVIFVGDQNQLPSVGPGSMLRDLINAGLPTACLTEIKRSDGGGRVVRACHAIKDGIVPQPAEGLDLPTENWIHIEESDPLKIARQIVDLHDLAKTMDPVWDFQVVSAQKTKHMFACDSLNQFLSAKLNPVETIEEEGNNEFELPFRIKDKVIRVKNGVVDQLKMIPKQASEQDDDFDFSKKKPETTWHWNGESYEVDECPIVNGDMGTVLDIVQEKRGASVVVEFYDPDRICRIPYSDHNLQQAYAITVHKSQGSGFPVVIVPVHSAFYWDPKTETGLFSRELFYTAISRAEQVLITVGQWSAVRAAVGRQTVHQRRTRLAELVQAYQLMEVGR